MCSFFLIVCCAVCVSYLLLYNLCVVLVSCPPLDPAEAQYCTLGRLFWFERSSTGGFSLKNDRGLARWRRRGATTSPSSVRIDEGFFKAWLRAVRFHSLFGITGACTSMGGGGSIWHTMRFFVVLSALGILLGVPAPAPPRTVGAGVLWCCSSSC